jgi:hypothetical protein
MSGSDAAVATRALCKRYREVLAVDSLDLHVRRGEIYGVARATHSRPRNRSQSAIQQSAYTRWHTRWHRHARDRGGAHACS